MKAFIGTTEGDLSIWHHTRLALSIAPTISRGAGGGGGVGWFISKGTGSGKDLSVNGINNGLNRLSIYSWVNL